MKKVKVQRYNVHFHARCNDCELQLNDRCDGGKEAIRVKFVKHIYDTGHEGVIENGYETEYSLNQ